MNRHSIYALVLSSLIGIGAASCTKYNEVDPPRLDLQHQEELPLPTHTISQLKALYKSGGVQINKPIVISAVIASDDSEGNLYKSCYIEDETGGMELKFALGNLSSIYPQGTRVRLLCHGLQLGDYAGQINLGYTSKEEKYETAFYPELLVYRTLLKEGSSELKPRDLTIATLSKQYAGTLIRLQEVQFLSSELGQTYADPQGKDKNRNVNRTLVDRSGRLLIVRTSSYAKFAGHTLPSGSGDVTAILTYFRDTPQLLILREQDVQLTRARF
ncbi:DUF5689 domain-containing protein [Porphyromonas sp.]